MLSIASKSNVFAGISAIAFVISAGGQSSKGPTPVPLPPPIASPVDVPYPGPIEISVDLSDNAHRFYTVHESIPVQAANLTLLYPKWIPGKHSPAGDISKFSGLIITADGRRIAWVRDRIDVFAFHVPIPEGVKKIDVEFEYLSPIRPNEGRISVSDTLLDLAWTDVILYPAGHFSRQILFIPSVKLPQGWKFATALDLDSQAGNLVHFRSTSLETLADSPLYAGLNYKRVDLSTGPNNRVFLNLFADAPQNLVMTTEQLAKDQDLVREAAKLYASRHYDHYDFLLLLSDHVGGIGLEHQKSSEDGEPADYLTKTPSGASDELLGHEYTHSWNGKFRRPADLWTPNFNVPMQGDLLWVYEGLTQYFGNVLTVRAGLRTPDKILDGFAITAADLDITAGRLWRPLVDTTSPQQVPFRMPMTWTSWQRGVDYYSEGMLIWLDADTKIRELSGDKKSIDDFARLFFGIDNGSSVTKTYTFEDLVAALNQVQPYDWAGFFKERVYDLATSAPTDGIKRSGYRLVYNDVPNNEARIISGASDFSTSLGFLVAKDGLLGSVWWNSPAFKAGLVPSVRILKVNGTAFSIETLHDTLIAAEKTSGPIQLLIQRDGKSSLVELDYHDGLHAPHFEKIPGARDRFTEIFAPSSSPLPQ